MYVVSASRRTDIPAFYTPWLLNRLREGFVRVPNPFNPHRIAQVDLRPEKVACLVLWTKDPRPLLPHVAELEGRGYPFLVHVTLTGLPPALEPAVPPAERIVRAVAELSRKIGSERIIWRFDPIVLSSLTPEPFLLQRFADLSGALEGQVRRVAVSFARYYRQVRTRLQRSGLKGDFTDLESLAADEALRRAGPLAEALVRTASRRGMNVVSCAEPLDLSPFGVHPAACIDAADLKALFGVTLSPRKDQGQRSACRCIRSIDIGMYGACRHGCLYCYARAGAALERGGRHDPRSSMLIGEAPRIPDPQGSLF